MRERKFFRLSLITLTLITATQLQAAGYRIDFQSASTLGNAGDAAVAQDASTNWYNAAGLVYIPKQLVLSAFNVYAPVNFSGTAYAPSAGHASDFTATGGAASHPNIILPAFHLAVPFKDNMAFGLSVTPSWGFSEDYGRDSILRYSLAHIQTKSLDVAPSFAMRLNKQWSIGFGPDAHYFSVQSRSSARTQPTTTADSISTFIASRVNYGGHAGVMYQLNDSTRFGLNYRSQITMNLEGDSKFILGDSNTLYQANNFKVRIPLPPVTTLSAYHDITPCWAVMGTVNYDQWSIVNKYKAHNFMQPTGPIANVDLVQNMHNTFDVGFGTNYKLSDKIMLRGAIKYLPSPTQRAHRQLSFPDGSKLGAHVGGRYQFSKQLAIDALYGHVFVKKANIYDSNPVTYTLTTGHTRSSIDFLGAQVVWDIV